MKRTPYLLGAFVLALSLHLPQLFAQVQIEELDGKIIASVDHNPVLHYHATTVDPPTGMDPIYARSGFIHPLFSPSGKQLTDGFPIGHVHQHGVFNAWTRATFKHQVVDFWNQHKKLGTVTHHRVKQINDDSFEVALRQISLNQGPAIHETWKVIVRKTKAPFIVDLEITQSCATTNEVYLHPYHYGGFGLRGSAHWSPEDLDHYEGSMKVLTGDGTRDIEASNHSSPRWVAAYGDINGEAAGFVVMDHPNNFRYPQAVRVHPKMPYFVFSPVVQGSFILKPGFSYTANYRIATFDGEPNSETVEEWYEDFIRP